MHTTCNECSLSCFTVMRMPWVFCLQEKKERKKKKRKEKQSKGLGFFSPGGFSQPQKLIQKLEISETNSGLS